MSSTAVAPHVYKSMCYTRELVDGPSILNIPESQILLCELKNFEIVRLLKIIP